jgi:hypothetical protein
MANIICDGLPPRLKPLGPVVLPFIPHCGADAGPSERVHTLAWESTLPGHSSTGLLFLTSRTSKVCARVSCSDVFLFLHISSRLVAIVSRTRPVATGIDSWACAHELAPFDLRVPTQTFFIVLPLQPFPYLGLLTHTTSTSSLSSYNQHHVSKITRLGSRLGQDPGADPAYRAVLVSRCAGK